MRLDGRHAIITGAGQGLGRQIALSFVKAGASVMICARTLHDLDQTLEEVRKIALPGQSVYARVADVSVESDIVGLIQEAIAQFGTVEVLVNNAGIHGPKGVLESVDSAEWIQAIHVNLMGVFYTTKHLLAHMKTNGYGKIINLSGGGATSPMPRMSAYAASKAAIVRLTETLAVETSDYKIDINALAPGAMNTRLLSDVLNSGPDHVGEVAYQRALSQRASGGSPPEKAADLAVYLASKESDGITGRLISAVWDPWETLRERLDALKSTDIYTLRRIIPEDRGQNWGASG